MGKGLEEQLRAPGLFSLEETEGTRCGVQQQRGRCRSLVSSDRTQEQLSCVRRGLGWKSGKSSSPRGWWAL